ncbi:MAG: hypothetical protein F9K26_08110 [Ignavibacteriaceae bacterium]|nr:MAG: hypothetical protein F9K26_08110 [Ignavibacteriaceae bacterium]MBW7873924.1 hypothetical protein [Ignavibacteria bacterium]MBZ0198011.1 hypothetical protein [Ignavibacteriaceae bacterium]OQY75104.1 MAG: hypothetical protein B6D45_06090 [Ignavibacteriales bacterium UTCHB3]
MSSRSSAKNIHLWRSPSPFNIYYSNINYLFLGIGVLGIIIGFVLLSAKPWDNPKALYFAPLLLVAAYVIILPVSLLFFKGSNSDKSTDSEEGSEKVE